MRPVATQAGRFIMIRTATLVQGAPTSRLAAYRGWPDNRVHTSPVISPLWVPVLRAKTASAEAAINAIPTSSQPNILKNIIESKAPV